LHDAVGGLGLAGGHAGLHRSGGSLGVGRVVLSELRLCWRLGRFTSRTLTPVARKKRASSRPKLPLPSTPTQARTPNSSTQATSSA
ncbi:MAG TPA: hypothetical protein VGW38_02535, partial [Chloroflexota bacterium]|nr:hypothetical protein [Chloroflexota bacterium]